MTDQTWETTIHEQQWLDAPTGPGWWWVVDSGEYEKPDYAPLLVAVQRRPDGRLWVGADLLRMVRDEPWAMEPVDDVLGWGAHKLWSPACLTPQRKEPTK